MGPPATAGGSDFLLYLVQSFLGLNNHIAQSYEFVHDEKQTYAIKEPAFDGWRHACAGLLFEYHHFKIAPRPIALFKVTKFGDVVVSLDHCVDHFDQRIDLSVINHRSDFIIAGIRVWRHESNQHSGSTIGVACVPDLVGFDARRSVLRP